MNRISFGAWLQITGPTFATMVLGFGLLWSQAQANGAQLLEVSRSMGRLEGSLDGIDARLVGIDSRLVGLDARLGKLDSRIDEFGASVKLFSERVESLRAK